MEPSALAPDSEAAIDAARRALAQGDLATIERLCQALIAARPDDGRVWSLLSETALRRNRLDAALPCAERAALLGPQDPVAHIMRAKCLLAGGEAGEALKAAETAAPLTNGASETAEALGAIFGMLGLHQRALAIFREALAVRPNKIQLLYNLAATERMLGALAAAEAHCDWALALDPNFHQLHYLRADLRTQTAARNHVAEMEALLERGVPSWQGEILLRYALGKECEDLEQYARAFHHYKAGADLQRRHLRYDLRADLAFIDGIIAAQTRTALQAPPTGFDGEEPIFILGLPRSGTTLVERILAGHPALVDAGELGALPLALQRETARHAAATGASAGPELWPALDPDALGRAYFAAARATGALPAGRLIDKFPGNYLHCGLIHRALPKAKIILLRRDPVDSCFAIYKTLFHGTYPFSYDLDELAAYYAAFRRLIEHWKATLPPTALIEVAYEDVVRDLPGQARRLVDFLGLPWDDAALRFHESRAPATTASAVQIRRPLYTSSIGKWRHFAAELAPLRAALAHELPDFAASEASER